MKKIVTLIVLLGLALATEAKDISRKELLNADWQFCLNDSDFARSQTVTLPHDWSIRQRFDRETMAGNDGAYLPTGRGWYRKLLTLGKDYQGKRLRLYFEGVYMNSHVYVNGQLAGGWPYGYSSFWVDVTPYIKIGKNEIVVACQSLCLRNRTDGR